MANIERHLNLGQLLLMHEVFLSRELLQTSLNVFARRSVEELPIEHTPRASRYEGLGNCRPFPSDPREQNQEANQEDGAQELCDVISCTLSCFIS